MDGRRHRAPLATLAVAIVTAVVLTVPVLALHALVVLGRRSGDHGGAAVEVLRASGPVVLGHAVAAGTWLAARRTGSARRAWLLAVAGTAVVLVVSWPPLAAVVEVFVEQWRETQPGGRGHQPG